MLKRGINMLRWIVRAVALGLCTGCAMWALTEGVIAVSSLRTAHPWLLFLLPAGALAIYFLYHELGAYLRSSTEMVISVINDGLSGDIHAADKVQIPVKMAPLIFVSTLISHLTGASTGKEGSGVMIGSSIGNYLSHVEDALLPKRWEQHDATTRGVWLISGAGAAFGALFGAPVAGTLFGLQFSAPGVNRTDAFIPCAISSYTAVIFSKEVLHIATLSPAQAPAVPLSSRLVAAAVIIAICAGLFCQLFLFLAGLWKKLLSRLFASNGKKYLFSSVLLLALSLALYPLYGGFPLNGLSSDLVATVQPWYTLLFKMVLTILSMGAGFVGGEVIPVLVLGSLAGCLFASAAGLPVPLMAMLSGMGMLSGATKLPFVCFALGMEIFGWNNPALLFITVVISFAVSGHFGIYSGQQRTVALEEGIR